MEVWPISNPELLVTAEGGVARITINRPHVLNALNRALLVDLQSTVLRLAADPAIRVLVFVGAGSKAFVAGADIDEFSSEPASVYEYIRLGQRVFNTIESLDLLTVAAINGYALGGGLELALACDLRIAAATAKLGNPEIKLGHFPGWGATQRLPRLIGLGRAKELILSGRMITAEEAMSIGLISSVVPQEELDAAAAHLAADLAAKPTPAAGLAKQALNMSVTAPLEAGLMVEAEGVSLCFGTPDQIEGIRAFRAKRAPRFGARKGSSDGGETN